MQHVEEAGVHSGDSSCVLPALSLTPSDVERVRDAVRRLGRALGVVGLFNVQLALIPTTHRQSGSPPEGELFVLEANPRASRTVPFASKAIGVNLVKAACSLMTGEPLSSLSLPPEGSANQVSVKAAVFPFARFPGADPVLGPEMRSTGEVMATAGDFPSAFAKAERAAGRPLPTEGRVFLSVRDADKDAAVVLGRRLAELGFEISATAGTADALGAAGLKVRAGRGARSDGYLIREAALAARVPCITTLAGAFAAVEAVALARREEALSLQERVLHAASSA
jgi:carbamoyl-phosphate synthase large subunit